MKSNWENIGLKVGSLDGNKQIELGGNDLAKKAIAEILGEEWIQTTVDHIVQVKRGSELAMNCLRLLESEKATNYAYEIYKNSNGERASEAVWLIKQIANPVAFKWVEEFLNDPNVMIWGFGLLDQLLWTENILYDDEKEKVDSLFQLALINSDNKLKEDVDFVKKYLNDRID